MSAATEQNPDPIKDFRQGILSRIRKDIIGTILMAIFLFLGAGRLNWFSGWAYILTTVLLLMLNAAVLIKHNPELMAKRGEITQEDTKDWDKIFNAVFGPLILVLMVVCGLDAGRFGWSTVPMWLHALGIIFFLAGWFFSLWAMVSNQHFETSVRIQDDREHKTITSGPYKIVRHPGYTGIIILYLFTSFFLHSWWGLIPGFVMMAAFIYRTAKEDQTLHEELPDYADFSRKVKYRLFPGIW